MSDFIQLEDWMLGLLEKFTPAQRRKLTQQWTRTLRQSQQKRIQQQLNPDGSPYEARKPQKRDKKGRVKRKMFTKIRTARYLKTKATPDMAEVSFSNSRIERIAATHQYGLREKLGKRGPVVKYPQRRLLGMNMANIENIQKIVLDFLSEY
ncbi:phage virion morphogenesis protein [Hafnia paralvei]|uniref:phage virion morphogenesis protein n=1 Tax=Hafnia paralvei TaxID=546367 RepID=UPI0024A86539|nr:phage virion morphogenesis protein [Hafnia paralvei]